MKSMNYNPHSDKSASDKLAADTKTFLENGGQIKVIPPGVSKDSQSTNRLIDKRIKAILRSRDSNKADFDKLKDQLIDGFNKMVLYAEKLLDTNQFAEHRQITIDIQIASSVITYAKNSEHLELCLMTINRWKQSSKEEL